MCPFAALLTCPATVPQADHRPLLLLFVSDDRRGAILVGVAGGPSSFGGGLRQGRSGEGEGGLMGGYVLPWLLARSLGRRMNTAVLEEGADMSWTLLGWLFNAQAKTSYVVSQYAAGSSNALEVWRLLLRGSQAQRGEW